MIDSLFDRDLQQLRAYRNRRRDRSSGLLSDLLRPFQVLQKIEYQAPWERRPRPNC